MKWKKIMRGKKVSKSKMQRYANICFCHYNLLQFLSRHFTSNEKIIAEAPAQRCICRFSCNSSTINWAACFQAAGEAALLR
jgi:hypothetical protein